MLALPTLSKFLLAEVEAMGSMPAPRFRLVYCAQGLVRVDPELLELALVPGKGVNEVAYRLAQALPPSEALPLVMFRDYPCTRGVLAVGGVPKHFTLPRYSDAIAPDVKLMLAAGAVPSLEVLPRAVKAGALGLVGVLLRARGLGTYRPGSSTPLHLACDGGCSDMVALLLSHGADVGARDSKGRLPLHYACTSGNTVSVKLMLEAGADPGAVDHLGLTPLHLATLGEVRALLTAGQESRRGYS
jgi:hypothetical protein